jgi:hypothetical protein
LVRDMIIQKIKTMIIDSTSPYDNWYTGITGDIQERLFSQHKINPSGMYIMFDAGDNETARDVENYFIQLGTKGTPAGGDSSSTIVYAYLMTEETDP